MASNVSTSLLDLVEGTLDILYRESERPRPVVVGSNALSSTSDTTFTLSLGSDLVNVTDIIEFGQEIILVTDKSADATPVFTCSRGYLNSPKSSWPTGTTGGLNPLWFRVKVKRAILQAFQGPLATHLPLLETEIIETDQNQWYLEVPAEAIDVVRLGYFRTITGLANGTPFDWVDLQGWQFEDDIAASAITSQKLVRIPRGFPVNTEIHVTYQKPYVWSDDSSDPGTDETATIDVPIGAGDLPSLYAAARLVTGREITRTELDSVEEWNQDQAYRQGVNIRLVQMLWNDFYRRLDETRRVQNIPRHRPYRSMRRA